jgi:hypothetical protein
MPKSSLSGFWIAISNQRIQAIKCNTIILIHEDISLPAPLISPIAVAYTKAFDGTRIKEPLIVVSYLSIMLWSALFSTITHSLTGIEIKYSIAVFALVLGYGHFRLVQFLAQRRRNKQ